jgi:hypothetical protein
MSLKRRAIVSFAALFGGLVFGCVKLAIGEFQYMELRQECGGSGNVMRLSTFSDPDEVARNYPGPHATFENRFGGEVYVCRAWPVAPTGKT